MSTINKKLFEAVRNGDEGAVVSLLDAGADATARYEDGWGLLPDNTSSQGDTPLHWAVEKGTPGMVDLLLAAGSDPDAKGRLGLTPLHLAADRGREDVCLSLLSAGADPSMRDNDGWNAAHHAAASEGAMAIIVGAGADIRAKGGEGCTPLHFAERANVVNMLVDGGSDIESRDNKGRTPLHFAAEEGMRDVCLALAAMGADTGALDSRNRTPLDLARKNGHMETAGAIESYVLAVKEKALVSQVCDDVTKMDSATVGNELRSMGEPVSEVPRAGRTTARRSMRL